MPAVCSSGSLGCIGTQGLGAVWAFLCFGWGAALAALRCRMCAGAAVVMRDRKEECSRPVRMQGHPSPALPAAARQGWEGAAVVLLRRRVPRRERASRNHREGLPLHELRSGACPQDDVTLSPAGPAGLVAQQPGAHLLQAQVRGDGLCTLLTG